MTIISTRSFGGISPKLNPRYLSDSQAQTATNCDVFSGSLRPMSGTGAFVFTTASGTQTIYKFGQDSTDPTTGWLDWSTDVDVARGQIAGDTEEWTYYTGDGYPKAIRASTVSSPIPMGLAAPTSAILPTLGPIPEGIESLSQETRVYTYTYVHKVGGRSVESAPAAPSTSIDVWPGQSVSLAGVVAPSAPYTATHVRIYRSTAGTYLFVAELDLSTAIAGFTDVVDPEDLQEEVPSLLWAHPPDDLSGLTNLPNGIMSGFVGRDVYFCEPYVPHAWPEVYRQALDFPVVGFGRIDTTLVVLTKGTPYIIQGSHPDSMVVIKSDLEQSCVSKRSIVSIDNFVFYAAPDGLVAVSPGGSTVVTEQLYTYKQWQEAFAPESIHAYQHDRKYIAFYNNGTTSGCFVFDTVSKQFSLHTIYASAGYNDMRNDTLYLVQSNQIRPWDSGSFLSYTWKSKVFTLPQYTGMGCAHVEAESYPVSIKVYADGNLIHTQNVVNRQPFRLPPVQARDWEYELIGSKEVFAVTIATSMGELAGA